MSKFLVFVLLVAACLCVVSAAPLNGDELLDADAAIQKIIAAYDRLGGSQIVYPPQVATYIDPNTYQVNF